MTDLNNNFNENMDESVKNEIVIHDAGKNDRKENQRIQLSRHIIQLISFFLFPELFITIYNSMKEIVSAVAKGNFHPAEMSSQIVLTVGILLITILLGRFFCGYMCAFGAVSDLLYSVFEKILPKKVHIPQKVDRYLKWVKYAILGFLVIGVWIFAVPVNLSYSPWNAFGGLVSGNINVVRTIIGTVGFFLLLAIFLGSIFIERFFCRYLCPLGAVFSPISKKRLVKIRKKAGGCTSCENCTRQCSMGIQVHEKEKVTSGECINCMKCISSCPYESLETNPAPVAVGVAAAVAIGGLVCVERISLENDQPQMTAKANHGMERGFHKNGRNENQRQDFRDDFRNGSEREENGNSKHSFGKESGDEENGNSKHSFGKESKGREHGNSERGFGKGSGDGKNGNSGRDSHRDSRNGKNDNSNQDSKKDSEKKSGEDNSNQNQNQNQEGEKIDLSEISDGKYTGTGNGFRGTIQVKVTVKNHKIENVTIESSRDDKQFLNKASSRLIQEIISSQSTDLDAVSGATFSSNGILEAVKNALSKE